jgi:hypothetical protein
MPLPCHTRAAMPMPRCFCSAAVSGTACGANQYADYEGYCVACGEGTAGADPKDRTKCLCMPGYAFFYIDVDYACDKLSRRLCLPLCVAMLPAGARSRHGMETRPG